jgi:hypothetical protein
VLSLAFCENVDEISLSKPEIHVHSKDAAIAHIRVGEYNFTLALVNMRPRNPSRTCVIAKPRTIESRTVMYVKASMGAKFANQEGWPGVINEPGFQSMFRA